MRVFPDSRDDNPLKSYFLNNQGNEIHKWHHYFDIYHNHFQRFRNKPVRILEIGVSRGGSLEMWQNYFGSKAQIFGVDINPKCKSLETEGIEIFIGNQADKKFLSQLKKKLGKVDILIDDGGHQMVQQIMTFEVLYDLVGEHGIYLVEDLQTSYSTNFRGGYRYPGTFIERAKGLLDSLNGWHTQAPDFAPDTITKTATGIHFYDGIMVIEKCPNPRKPAMSRIGSNPFAKPKV